MWTFDHSKSGIYYSLIDFKNKSKARNKKGTRYSELLNGHVNTSMVLNGKTHFYAQYTIRVDEGRRDEILTGMKESGIPVGVYYPKCFHEQPVFNGLGYKYGDFPESEKASR